MTEAEAKWLAYGDPRLILNLLRRRSKGDRGGGLVRKLALFARAGAHRIWHLIPQGDSQDAVILAERAIDGLASVEELRSACTKAHAAWDVIRLRLLTRGVRRTRAMRAESYGRYVAWYSAACGAGSKTQAFSCAGIVAETAAAAADGGETPEDWAESFRSECDLLRDIFNPFRPVRIDPSWLTWNDATVHRIAQGIYEERRLPEGTLDSGRLAILSDALLDAGCDNEELIAHCRSPGPHVRGCWALDQILAKE